MLIQPNFEDADDFYERLLDAHEGLNREQSEALNARLILAMAMANAIGRSALLEICLKIAKGDL